MLLVACVLTMGGAIADDAKSELAKLQGTWRLTSLEANGSKMGEGMLAGSTIVIAGDKFTAHGMGAEYGGTLKLNPAAKPKTLDMVFTTGPEKGNTSRAIYELSGDTWRLCLTVTAKARPKSFAAPAGSGLALETLRRGEPAGKPGHSAAHAEDTFPAPSAEATAEIEKLGGEWSMVSVERDGQSMQAGSFSGTRTVKGNETTVMIGGQLYMKFRFTVDPTNSPKTIDYKVTDGMNKGATQLGIYALDGDTVRFCFAGPGQPRPNEFKTKAGDTRTLSVWKRAKP